jgi:uncharacterized protein (TIGR02246 family)
MKLRLLLIALIAVASVTSAATQPKKSMDARQAAEVVLAKFDVAFNKQDAAGIAALFVPGGTFVPALPSPTLGAVMSGQQKIEKFFSAAFHTFTTESLKVVKAGPLGDTAVWAVADLHLTGQGQNGPVEIRGHVGTVFVRSGGTWKIQMTIANGKPVGNGAVPSR